LQTGLIGDRSGPQEEDRKRTAIGVQHEELIQGRRKGIRDGPDETHSKKFGFLILGIDMKYRRRERQ
jgi:hypothetical protein